MVVLAIVLLLHPLLLFSSSWECTNLQLLLILFQSNQKAFTFIKFIFKLRIFLIALLQLVLQELFPSVFFCIISFCINNSCYSYYREDSSINMKSIREFSSRMRRAFSISSKALKTVLSSEKFRWKRVSSRSLKYCLSRKGVFISTLRLWSWRAALLISPISCLKHCKQALIYSISALKISC